MPRTNPRTTAPTTPIVKRARTPASARNAPPRADQVPSQRLATPAAQRHRPSKTLDVFDNPSPHRDYTIRFDIPEFTCLCPLTGQPDFAHFVIEVVPDKLCIELKSLKMYMWSFRDEGAFHERVTNAILDDIVKTIQPRFARIVAAWNVRGGITTDVMAEHRKKGWRPAADVALPALRVATAK